LNLRPPGYETSRSSSSWVRSACLSHFRSCSITLDQLRWVQNGYKIRVSSGNRGGHSRLTESLRMPACHAGGRGFESRRSRSGTAWKQAVFSHPSSKKLPPFEGFAAVTARSGTPASPASTRLRRISRQRLDLTRIAPDRTRGDETRDETARVPVFPMTRGHGRAPNKEFGFGRGSVTAGSRPREGQRPRSDERCQVCRA
jgi:hypothetical protein